MKKLICLLLVLFMINNVGYSQESDDWIYVGVSKGGDRMYVKSSYVSKDEGVVTIWVKQYAKKKTFTTRGKSATYTNVSVLTLYQVDCDQTKINSKSMYIYNAGGILLKSIKLEDYESNWTDVIPDSMGEALFNKVCELFRE